MMERKRESRVAKNKRGVERSEKLRARKKRIYVLVKLRLYSVKRISRNVCRQQHAFKYLTTISTSSYRSLLCSTYIASLHLYFLSFLYWYIILFMSCLDYFVRSLRRIFSISLYHIYAVPRVEPDANMLPIDNDTNSFE